MQTSINLMFDGNCRQAVAFYADTFHLPLPEFVTYGDRDMSFDPNIQLTEQGKLRIMNATLQLFGTTLLCNDMPENFVFQRGNSFGITLRYDNAQEAEAVFARLAENGSIFVPFSSNDSGDDYGLLADQFDMMWTITS